MDKHIVILGGGPGGYSAALVAAQKGLKVTLIEKNALGGTCLNRGCIPTKALLACSELYGRIKEARKFGIDVSGASADVKAMMARKDKIVTTLRTGLEGIMKKRGVRIVTGKGTILDNRTVEVSGERIAADFIIIATGTEVMRFWEGEGIITSDEALAMDQVPGNLLVVGAGAVGIELGCFYAELGSRVTIVEMMPQILPGIEKELSETLARELKKKGITLRASTKISTVKGTEVVYEDGRSERYDAVLQAVGRRFNTESIGLENVNIEVRKGRIDANASMETVVPGIYAIGDIVAGSPLLAHSAMMQGIVAALNSAGEAAEMDYRAIPQCVYSHPEVASCGLQESQVEDGRVARIPYRAMGRAHASGEIAGLMKIVADKKTGIVKGIHIVGEKATEIIHEGILALKSGATVQSLAEVIRAHPTFSEVYSEAYHFLEGRAIHFMQ